MAKSKSTRTVRKPIPPTALHRESLQKAERLLRAADACLASAAHSRGDADALASADGRDIAELIGMAIDLVVKGQPDDGNWSFEIYDVIGALYVVRGVLDAGLTFRQDYVECSDAVEGQLRVWYSGFATDLIAAGFMQ